MCHFHFTIPKIIFMLNRYIPWIGVAGIVHGSSLPNPLERMYWLAVSSARNEWCFQSIRKLFLIATLHETETQGNSS